MGIERYRPEIDGLRALSILGVVLYHARLGMPGGYVGVDVFFVISGYLITRLILHDQQAGQFSVWNFWERRIRRIYPALVVTLLGTLAGSSLILLPADLCDTARAAASQTVLASNFYFWRHTGYFAAPAELQPLLHTWSLAVEEQFYVGFPLLMWFCRNWTMQYRRMLFIVLAAGLWVACWYATKYHPVAAFYLAPFRAWELLLGSIAAQIHYGLARRWFHEAATTAGLVMILLAMLVFHERTWFPGAAALLPTFGAVLVLLFAHRVTWTGRVLSHRLATGLGLISYSLYLWHWPLLSWGHYVGGMRFESLGLRLLLSATAVVFAYSSWRWIEQPVRRREWLGSTRWLLLASFVGTLLVIAGAGAIALARGFPNRFPDRVLHLAMQLQAPDHVGPTDAQIQQDQVTRLGAPDRRPTALLWGDSHAVVLEPLMDELGRRWRVGVYSVAREATPIVTQAAAEHNRLVLDFIGRHSLRFVFLVARWSGVYDQLLQDRPFLISSEEWQYRQTALDRLLGQLKQLGCSVWIMKEVPAQPGGDAYRAQLVYSEIWPHWCRLETVSFEHYLQATRKSRHIVWTSALRNQARALDPVQTCFDTSGRSRVRSGDRLFYFDDDHLTAEGARILLGPLWEPVFARIGTETK